jgi:CopG family transcriptional regulator, nickel-responsive regulator
MQRIAITVDDDLMSDLDRVIEARGYQNRSEAIRDLARAGIQQAVQDADATRDCVGALVYVYDHSARTSTRFTTATTCRWQRYMSISTTIPVWKSLCSKDAHGRYKRWQIT